MDPPAIRERADRAGIGLLTSVVCPEDADPSSEEDAVRERGLDFLKRCIDATADMGADVIRVAKHLVGQRIAEPNVGIHLDAYHMNIEENEFRAPVVLVAEHILHFHLSESHRGIPGRGTVDWEAIMSALGDAGYAGHVGLESFAEVSDAMRGATCIWRDLAPSSDELVSEGLAFLKGLERTAAPV